MEDEKVAEFMGGVKAELNNVHHRLNDIKEENEKNRAWMQQTFNELRQINERCKKQEREEFMKIHQHVRDMDETRIQPLENWRASIDTYGKVGAIILTIAQGIFITIWTVVVNKILR